MKYIIQFLAGFGLYILAIIPELLYISTQGKEGIKYPIGLLLSLGFATSFLSIFVFGRYIVRKKQAD